MSLTGTSVSGGGGVSSSPLLPPPFSGEGWIQYNIHFRKRAAAFPLEKWAKINPTLRQLAFANAMPRTLEHTTNQCDDYESESSSVMAGDVRGKHAGS